MTEQQYLAIIVAGFPPLILAIVTLWKYTVRLNKENNERQERMITATVSHADAMEKVAATNMELSKEIAGLKVNTLLQTEVLKQIRPNR